MFNTLFSGKKLFTINSLRELGYAGAYYKPSDSRVVVHASNAVSDVYDALGQDITLSQTTAGKKPTTNTRTINGVNVFDFNSADSESLFGDVVASGFSGTNVNFSFYAVVQRDLTPSVSNTILCMESSSSASPLLVLRLLNTNVINVYRSDNSGANTNTSTTKVIDTNPHIISVTYDGTTLKIYLDGSNVLSTSISALGATTFNRLRIGSPRELGSQYFDGGIGDTLILTSNPTDAIDDKIIGRLAWRYLLQHQLDYNQTYRFDGRLFTNGYKLWKPTTADIASLVHIEPNAVANVTQSADAVSQLTTVQGSLTLVQATGSQQPNIATRTINGVKALDFIATSSQTMLDNINALATALSGTDVPFAFYAVVTLDLLGSARVILSIESSSSATPYLSLRSSSLNYLTIQKTDDAGNTMFLDTNPTISLTASTYLVSCRFDGVDAKIYVNGTLIATGNLASSLGVTTLNQVRIGARVGVGQYWDGAIGSVLAMAENPTDAMHEKIEGFIAHQYKLTNNLPALHPYKTNPPLEY